MLRKETTSLKKRRGQLYYLLFNQLLRYSLQSKTVVFGIPFLTRIVGQCVDNMLTSVFSVSAQIKRGRLKTYTYTVQETPLSKNMSCAVGLHIFSECTVL